MISERNYILDPYLVFYLPLHKQDGSSLISEDTYGHSLTATGALWKPSGRTFDGVDDYVALPDNILDNASSWTVNLWLKAGDITTNKRSPIGGSLTAWNEMPSLRHYGGKYQVNALHSSEFIVQSQSTSGDVLLDQWENVCFLYDGYDCLFYRDGELTDTLGALEGKSLDATTVYSRLGGGQSTSSLAYSGMIGEVLIYNRALTPLEIQHNYLLTRWKYQ